MAEAGNPGIRKVALFCKFQRTPDITSAVISLVKCLRVRGIAIATSAATAELSGIERKQNIFLAEPAQVGDADMAVVVGGDGTFISLAREIAPLGVPMLGINLGRVGYLTDVNIRGMVETMSAILEGEYFVEERMMALVRQHGVEQHAPVVNDVVVSRGSAARIIELSLSVDGVHASILRSDGIVVATPTGSTAYSMAASGPIIMPTLDSMTIVALNPYSLTSRPLVVHPDSEIGLKLIKGDETLMHLDGQVGTEIREGDEIRISRSPQRLRVVHPRGYDFYQNLREKLHWTR